MIIQQLSPSFTLLVDSKPDRQTCKLECWYSAGGSIYEAKKDRGRRHLLEHLLVARTKELNDTQFKEWCYDNAIQFNAYTSSQVINLNGRCHQGDAKHMIPLFAELFLNPTWDEEVFAKEKEIVLREIADRVGDTEYTLWKETCTQLYTPDSIEAHEVLGDYEAVQSSTLQDMKRMHSELLNDSHLFFSISGGGINHEVVEEMLKPLVLEFCTHQPQKDLPFVSVNTLLVPRLFPLHHTLAHQEISMTVYIPIAINYDNGPIRRAVQSMYFGWNGSGLYDWLRDTQGLLYSMHTSFDHSGQYLRIDLNCQPDAVQKIIDNISVYFATQESKDNQVRFETLKKTTIKSFQQGRDVLGFEAEFWVDNQLYFGKKETPDEYLKLVEAVTYTSIVEYMQKIILSYHNNSKIVLISRDDSVTLLDLVLPSPYGNKLS